MEKSRQFNQEQKLVILEGAKEVGIKEASRIGGVHYTTVYEWWNRLEALGRDGFLSYCSESRGRGTSLSQSHRQPLLFDAKYPLTNKNSSPIHPPIESNTLSKTHRSLTVTASDERL